MNDSSNPADEIIERARAVTEIFRQKKATLALAESCTGGLCAAALTEIPGVSSVFLCGYTVYSNEAKRRDLGVSDEILTRCGACYHDIGKIDQAEFFAENQTGINKHDEIQPNLSIVVIKSHVVNGVNKAKALRLPQEVIDIIEQHHGNSVINYFYVQALKQGKSVPTEEDYSYKTPLPQSKEAGIVMIADVVEAATRSLPSPVSVVQVEKFIDKIISDKINNGQFAESKLTFSDVYTIKNVLLRMVCSNLHTRPEYPDKTEAVKGKTNE